jgi:hypothetical protein
MALCDQFLECRLEITRLCIRLIPPFTMSMIEVERGLRATKPAQTLSSSSSLYFRRRTVAARANAFIQATRDLILQELHLASRVPW